MALPLLSAGVPSVIKGISGLFQSKKGKKLASSNLRPTYTRPVEVDQALSVAKNNYYNGSMPGQDQLIDQVGSATAGGITSLQQGASSSADLLDGINKISTGSFNALSDIQRQAALFRLGQMGAFTNQLNNSAAYADKEFDYNQNVPHEQRSALSSSLINAGNVNLNNALGELGSLGVSATMGRSGVGTTGLPNPRSFGSYSPSAALSGKMIYNPTLGQVKYTG